MNRKLYKLQQIGDRLWILAAMTAMQAAALGRDGRGFAIVAEETRKMTDKMQYLVEQAMFDDEDVDMETMKEKAHEILLLALNAAIEANRLQEKGKQAAVCAEEIRALSYMLANEISDDIPLDRIPKNSVPWAKTPLSTIPQLIPSPTFILLKTAETFIVENLLNVQEVCYGFTVNKDNRLMLRGNELPVINVSEFLNRKTDKTIYIILCAPWADESAKYAVAVESFECLFYSPIGTPIAPPADMPLSKYVRECWENENGEPFYFMDWIKMAN